MTNERTSMVVFKDGTGDYFLVPRELLERGRVPAERRAEVEQLIAASDDARGYSVAMAASWLRLAGHSFDYGEYRDALKMVGYAIEEVQKELGGRAW